MFTSLLYNINVATSITSQGRALVSSMTLFFEMFLNNNVKFGSLNEVVQFIEHITSDKRYRKFNDNDFLDKNISKEDCFAKLIDSCGYRWIPNEEEMEIIWRIVNNLSTEDINRVYYKNNLYEFMSNEKIFNIVRTILKKLKTPLFNSVKIPKEISNEMELLSSLTMEYVYYKYMFIDRTDRCDNMIKSVTMVSDTDSTIISLDAWYRFVAEKMNGEELRIANYCKNPVMFGEWDDFDKDWVSKEWQDQVEFQPKPLDYNFETDEIVELEHTIKPDVLTPNDNVRYSIINILANILDRAVNDYMEEFCLNNHSLSRTMDDPIYHENLLVPTKVPMSTIKNDIETTGKINHSLRTGKSLNRVCKILAKNEFTFTRLMMTKVKKNYASLIAVQEGNVVPENKQFDVKGIECMTKSSKSESTRNALKKILLEDVMRAPVIDQLKLVKDVAILEKRIVESIRSGSKEFYKPATIKSMNSYDDPMRIQGIKASIAWNSIKDSDLPGIDLEERNPINIVKVIIDKNSASKIIDKYPTIYNNIIATLEMKEFADSIKAVAIPLDTEVPIWMMDFIDYTTLVADCIGSFPFESMGIMRMNKSNVNYTNIVQL